MEQSNSAVIEKIKRSIQNLPTLPTVLSLLNDAMANPMTTTDDVAKIIATDQASAFKVLRVANSPFYGFSGRIDTISQAILHLGFNEVRNIVLALSIINLFSKNKTLLSFKPVNFWHHSIAVGVTTRMIGSHCGSSNLENYFLSGILHDIGKLLFFEYADTEYIKVLTIVDQKGVFIREAEKEVFGIDHADAAKLLAERWRLPFSIKNALAYHHTGVVNTVPDILTSAVHLADIFARMMELGYPGDNLVPQPNKHIWTVLKLPRDFFSKFSAQIISSYEESVNLLLHD